MGSDEIDALRMRGRRTGADHGHDIADTHVAHFAPVLGGQHIEPGTYASQRAQGQVLQPTAGVVATHAPLTQT
jgi:hypothetical protein